MARGGHRENAGRKPGTPNKATAELKAIAQEHGAKAIAELIKIATKGESEAARIAACREILDRGYGKAPQAIVGSPDEPSAFPSKVQISFIDAPPSETREEWIARRERELATPADRFSRH